MLFSQLISSVKSSRLFTEMRKIKYRNKRKHINQTTKLTLLELEVLLTEYFKVKKGDSLMIHSGFGFLNAEFTPQELIKLLKELVGPQGHIAMPFYPPGLSSDWAKANRIFDVNNVKCSTGVVAQVFSNSDDVIISNHPIKAVAVWGPQANELINQHESSDYPFDKNSPYYKFSQITSSKSIGLGVLNCAMVHCAEDIYETEKNYLYNSDKIDLSVVNNDKSQVVPTYFHHGNIKLENPASYLEKNCSDILNVTKINDTVFYLIDNKKLMDSSAKLIAKGVNRRCS
jgi:aminoglycoside N3'-acetyltransferase